jgi:uncharacterized protein YkwD
MSPFALPITIALCLLIVPTTASASAPWESPSLHPPRITQPGKSQGFLQAKPLGQNMTEWVYHKSADGIHPSGQEQQVLWLMNRARSNPATEGQWLATEPHTHVASGRNYFHVNITTLRNEFSALDPKPPAAFDRRLYNAALAHSLDLIARDAQDHTNQFDRVDAAGFHSTQMRGCVFSYAKSGLNNHAALNIDWGGDDGTGMQTGRGHRKAIMSSDGHYTNVGIAAVAENNSATRVGPLVTTGNYARANSNFNNHYNTFLVGTVWRDINNNSMYDPGEGITGIRITPVGGNYYAITGASGGYAIPLATGSYTVRFTGTALSQDVEKNISIAQQSVLLDLIPQAAASTSFSWPLFLPAITGANSSRPRTPDCNGVPGGSAYIDHCNSCVGGTTGRAACRQDCEGVWGGNAVEDRCGVCNGDGSTCARFERSQSGNRVTDLDTGLQWQDTRPGFKTEAEGITYCNDKTIDGLDDWRLPDFDELQTFFRAVDATPAFDLDFWGTTDGCTASVAIGGYVLTPAGADRYNGETGDRINFSGGAAARCVR